MSSNGHHWIGKSGKPYWYAIHELPWLPDPNQYGNYIFAKFVNGRWQPVYIGEGDLRDRYNAALREGCVTKKNATHYHEHLQSSKSAGVEEEADLIAGNPDCMEPTGCNKIRS